MKPSYNCNRNFGARDAARFLHLSLSATITSLAVALVSVGVAADYPLIIEYTNRNYVSVHFGTVPSKVNTLQGAFVYATNTARLGYTNLAWSNLVSYPPLRDSVHYPAYQDYSVTNRFTNRFRIYRVKAT